MFSLKPWRAACAVFLILALPALLIGTFARLGMRFYSLPASGQTDPDCANIPTVILDPGHGGRDGGAVSLSGREEKEINLNLSLRLGAILRACGVKVIYTRSEDVMLDSGIGETKKMRDLTARLAIMKEAPQALFVSIHMNKYPTPDCRGAQIWYGEKPGARALALAIEDSIKTALQPHNHRKCKEAGEDIFLLHRAEGAAVLIECGFLSHPEESALLDSPAYLDALAIAIAEGILSHLCASQAS